MAASCLRVYSVPIQQCGQLEKAKEEQDAAAIATIYEALDELRTAWHSVSQPTGEPDLHPVLP